MSASALQPATPAPGVSGDALGVPGLAAPARLRLGGVIGPTASARWDRPVENRPQDIAAAKSALYWAAYQPDDPASLPQTDYDADLSNTIHNFQAINGLKRDGPPLTYGSGGRRRRGRLL